MLKRNPLRALACWLALTPALLLAVPALAADTLADTLSRYRAARGGEEAWRKLTSIELTGTFISFSEEHPMRFAWRRPGLIRFETNYLDGPVLVGADEGGPWWALHFQENGKPTSPGESQDILLNFHGLGEPLLLAASLANHKVELLPRGDIDGQPTLRVQVTRPDGGVETWHLDPATYLELAIDCTVTDMSQKPGPMAQRTYLSDFRKVGGVLMPFRVEKEYGARNALLSITSAKTDGELPASAFARVPVAPPVAASQGGS